MNMLEDAGGRLCGTEFLFSHALDPIPKTSRRLEALARSALADPMIGSCADRADRICRDMEAFGAEALLVSRIPGGSHCALEGTIIGDIVRRRLGVPVVPRSKSRRFVIQSNRRCKPDWRRWWKPYGIEEHRDLCRN